MTLVRLVLLCVLLLLGALASCRFPGPAEPPGVASQEPAGGEDDPDEEGEPPGARPGSAPTATPRPLPTTTVGGLRVELIAEGLQLPQSLRFAPDGRLFFVEVKKGEARVMTGRTLQPEPVLTVNVSRGTEHGLISVTPDPGFPQNRFLYTYYSRAQKGTVAAKPLKHRLTRWTERDGKASDEIPILDDIPIGKGNHTGGKLAFADDGTLYLAIGDQGDASRRLAQESNKLNGKLLRFDPGLAPSIAPKHELDAKQALTYVYASGMRNPYGLDVHPATGMPLLTDNGPDMCDEINLARQAGANFGNPDVECSPGADGFEDPIWESGLDRLGVTGLRVYRGTMFPEYVNNALFCAVNTGNLMMAVLEPPRFDRVARVEQIVSGSDGEGCRLDLELAADGSIYYSSMSKLFRLSR